MATTLSHRGPDSDGIWVDALVGVGLGHRRLAIRDLSAAGHQPMESSCGRWVIVYNGEIYSHREIATDLEQRGCRMRGACDTEVIVESIAVHGVRSPLDAADDEHLDRLDALLGDAVERRLITDVSLGALLSGGIDSSLVAALMQERCAQPIKTFAIGFDVPGYDEAPYARAIAEYLGTEHTELYAQPEHALDLVQRLPHVYDEPFADSSQLPTMLVSELTRSRVSVALTGDGGDELFAGYQRYAIGRSQWSGLSSAPMLLRRATGGMLLRLPESAIDRAGRLIPASRRPEHLGRKLHKLARSLAAASADDLYLQMLSQWPQPDQLVLGGREPHGVLWDRTLQRDLPHLLDRMQLVDSITYLPDDILTKVDRASMAYALETRVPLLDHRVVEFAWRLPRQMKVRDGQAKWALRKLLERRVPRSLFDRPKMGFGVPIDHWMRGPLRSWCEHLLDPARLRDQGLLDPAPVRARWQQHLDGQNWAYPLWTILMLQAWIDQTLVLPGER